MRLRTASSHTLSPYFLVKYRDRTLRVLGDGKLVLVSDKMYWPRPSDHDVLYDEDCLYVPWLVTPSSRKRKAQSCTLPLWVFFAAWCFLAWYLPLNCLRFSYFCAIPRSTVLIGWHTTCHRPYFHFLRGSSATPSMSSSKTGSAVQNSDSFVEQVSVLAVTPLPHYSNRSQVRAFSRAPVAVGMCILILRTGFAPTFTRISWTKPRTLPLTPPHSYSSSSVPSVS